MIRTIDNAKGWPSDIAYDLAVDMGERHGQYFRNALKQYHAAIRQNLLDL